MSCTSGGSFFQELNHVSYFDNLHHVSYFDNLPDNKCIWIMKCSNGDCDVSKIVIHYIYRLFHCTRRKQSLHNINFTKPDSWLDLQISSLKLLHRIRKMSFPKFFSLKVCKYNLHNANYSIWALVLNFLLVKYNKYLH